MTAVEGSPARYVCKVCGAESPTGIGYVAGSGRVSFPDPDPTCPNPHLWGDIPKGQACTLAAVFLCDPYAAGAPPQCGRGCVGHLAPVCDRPAVHRVTHGTGQQYACADHAGSVVQ
jgi:hypothetical protein